MADWDDGKHTLVRKVSISYGTDGINSFQAEYEIAGNSLPGVKHGKDFDTSDGFTLKYPGEYLTSVTGYYKTTWSGDVVTSLTFNSNTGSHGPFGVKTKNYFSVDIPKDNKIVGFKGKSGSFLNELNVHYGPIVTDGGGEGGLDWDDKDKYNGVINFDIGYDDTAIRSITLAYEQTGTTIPAQRRGGPGGTPALLQFKHPDEYLISVTGTYGQLSPTSSGAVVIKSLKLVTNKQTYGPYGPETGTAFTLSSSNQQIIGFRGRSGAYLDAIEAYYGPIPSPEPRLVGKGPFGSDGGKAWNHGDGYSGVKKIEIVCFDSFIYSFTVLYDDNGSDFQPPRLASDLIRTSLYPDFIKFEIVFDYPEEYILSVSGTFSYFAITSLTIQTNKRKYPTYGTLSGTAFKLASAGERIIGFRGTSGTYLNTLGAHFGPGAAPSGGSGTTEVGSGPYGAAGGLDWNDRDEYSGVKKIDVGYDDSVVHSITVVYDDNGSTISAQRRGGVRGNKIPVELKFPDEYLISVSGTYSDVAITSLTLESNKTSYGPFGKANGKAFKLTSPGSQIIGFCGTSGAYLDTLGAYFGPTPTLVAPARTSEKLEAHGGDGGNPTPVAPARTSEKKLEEHGGDGGNPTPVAPARTSEKLEAHGGDGGNPFDDGENEGIKEILVGDSSKGIQYLKFKYVKDGQTVDKEHGDPNTGMPLQTVLLNYPDEYLTLVEGTYNVIPGPSALTSIQSLTFKTNKDKEHGPYGFADGTAFKIDGKSGKFVGFHGQASNVIYKLGVHLKPASS